MTMMNTSPLPRFAGSQHGVALITGLIFLVVLTLIAITAARMSGLEERMAGNTRDRSLAVQAAEMALRDAELDIRRPAFATGITGFDPACTNGLCYNGKTGNSNGVDWNAIPVWTTVSMTAAPSIEYGSNTGATPIAGLSAKPRYLIEGIQKLCLSDATGGLKCGSSLKTVYRITVRAQGANPNTVVWMQEVFRP